MKTLVLLAVLFSSFVALSAQNWHPFPGNVTYHYWFQFQPSDLDTFFYSARIDSVRLEGADSAYYLYRMDRPMYNGEMGIDCNGDPFQGSFDWILSNADHYFGKKMLLDAAGNARFVSSMGDTFTLQLQAPMGATWLWTPGVNATVTGLGTANILGVADSVKTISLGNGSTIVLSKDHGFVDTYSFLTFAEQYATYPQTTFHLCGIPSMNLGRELPHTREIYTFEVGDKFCRYRSLVEGLGYTDTWEHQQITGIVPCPDPTYDYVNETYREIHPPQLPVQTFYGPPTAWPGICPGYVTDTILERLPYEHHGTTGLGYPAKIQRGYHTFSGYENRVGSHVEWYFDFNVCAAYYFTFETAQSESYVAGLGSVEDFYGFTNEIANHRYMYAYEKGSGNVGTCLDLHAMEVTAPSAPQCSISPNPASNIVQITMEKVDLSNPTELRILNAEGRLLMHTNFPANSTTMQLSVSDLPSGLYLLEILQDDAVALRRKLVVAR